MSYGTPPGLALLQDDLLTRGVLLRRILAFFVDVVVLSILCSALYAGVLALGLVTLGFGWTLLWGIPFVPAAYYFLSLISPMQATPGQALLGLVVVDNASLAPPTLPQALVCVIVYGVCLPALWVLMLIGLITTRRRLLHDLLSGLVVVRARALAAPLTGLPPRWTMQG
jgi:uncharacterized RDD family membrane protein YckC